MKLVYMIFIGELQSLESCFTRVNRRSEVAELPTDIKRITTDERVLRKRRKKKFECSRALKKNRCAK